LKIYLSQGTVATQLMCGGIFSNHFITNFPQNVPVNKFRKSVNVWQRYCQKLLLTSSGHLAYRLVRSLHRLCIQFARSIAYKIRMSACDALNTGRLEEHTICYIYHITSVHM